MNEREEAPAREGRERDRESNGGRDFYPGSHGFEETRERASHAAERFAPNRDNPGRTGQDRYAQDRYGYGRYPWGPRSPQRSERMPWNERARWRESFPRDLYGREHSSEQLFDREPFGHFEETRYYGTGSAGVGGPGFTGGAYGYGEGPREQPRRIADEFSDESAVSYEHGSYGRGSPRRRMYPPGPKGYQRSDERLREDICERLMGAYYIDSSEVTVDVKGGKVTLEGSVPSRHMKHAIEDIVDACPGIVDIDNRVRVGTTPAPPNAR